MGETLTGLTTDQREAIVREYIDRVFIEHHAERAREYVAPGIVWHGGSLGTITGVDNLVGVLGGFIAALPDIRPEVQDVIANGDLVAVRQVIQATQTGVLLGIPATGRRLQWDALDIYRITDDGKISEQWSFQDMAAVGAQTGVFSLPWAAG